MKPKSNALLEFWKKSLHIFKNIKTSVGITVKHNHESSSFLNCRKENKYPILPLKLTVYLYLVFSFLVNLEVSYHEQAWVVEQMDEILFLEI